MMRALPFSRALVATALLCPAIAVAQDEAVVTLPLRVTAVTADGKVVVDRGRRDFVQRGDRIELLPSNGDRVTAIVVQVDERSSLVELVAGAAAPSIGCKGELRVPKSRLPAPTAPRQSPPNQQPAPSSSQTPSQSPSPSPPERAPSTWPERADGWKPGMPLLAAVRPLRPDEREPEVSGRVFSVLGVTGNTLGDGFEPFGRVGTELDASNPFELGGALHFDAELDYRRMQDDSQRGAFLLRRLSYSKGGDRFDRDRIEFGRFLHQVFPELGVVDGAQWTRRLEDGSRIGASLGFLPVPDDEFQSFADLQFAAYGEWLVDPDGTTRVGGAVQKTWHNGRSDRDAMLFTFHQAPIDGWQVHGSARIDFYFGDDDIKGRGVELTTGYLSLGRRFETSGFDLGVRRTRYPEQLRHEFRPLLPDELRDERFDRATLDTWAQLGESQRAHANLSGFDDEERRGGAAELGLLAQDVFARGLALDVTGFGGRAQFERLFGGRATLSSFGERGHWQALYEIGWHRIDDRPTDGNDLVQHRLAFSLDHRTDSGWVVGASADAVVWDAELSWSLQFTLHRNF